MRGFLQRGGVVGLPAALPGFGTEANECLAELRAIADRLNKATIKQRKAQDAANAYPSLRTRELADLARSGEPMTPDKTEELKDAAAQLRDEVTGLQGAQRTVVFEVSAGVRT